MTVQEMIIKIYEVAGNHTEFLPYTDVNDPDTFSIATKGAVKGLGEVNNAIRILMNWKFRNGRHIKIPGSTETTYFQVTTENGTLEGGGSSTATFPTTLGANAQQYTGWIISLTGGTGEGQERLIMNYSTGRIAAVHKAWDIEPDSTTTFAIYHREYRLVDSESIYAADHINLNPIDKILSVLKLGHVGGNMIDKGSRSEGYFSQILEYGDPTEYIHEGDKIIFNSAPDDKDNWYLLEYIKQPVVLTTAAQELPIPVGMQDAIWLYCSWVIHIWDGDDSRAWARKKDLVDFMENQPYQEDMDDDRSEHMLISG